jgi:hypothetical protein
MKREKGKGKGLVAVGVGKGKHLCLSLFDGCTKVHLCPIPLALGFGFVCLSP